MLTGKWKQHLLKVLRNILHLSNTIPHARAIPLIGAALTSWSMRNGRCIFTPPVRSLGHHFFKGAVCKPRHTFSSAGTAIVTGIETKNVEETLKAAALAGSESFKWGAIVGVVSGGVSETVSLAKSAKSNPTPRESELKVLERTKGAEEQISYLDGVEVSSATKGATRPDVVVKNADGSIKAIEVKNYNLASSNSRSELYRELERQVTSRANNLPAGSTQEIVLDVRGRGFSKDVIDNVVANIQSRCAPVYKDISVTVMSY